MEKIKAYTAEEVKMLIEGKKVEELGMAVKTTEEFAKHYTVIAFRLSYNGPACKKFENRFYFTPQFVYGNPTSMTIVTTIQGTIIGSVYAEDVPAFMDGFANLLTPIDGWKESFSQQLTSLLELTPEHTMPA